MGSTHLSFLRRTILPILAGIGLVVTVSTAGAAQSAPIFQPGAPGEPAREISRERSLDLGRSRYVAADARFMQHMIVHHAQAVEMGALIEPRTDHPGIRLIGERIALSQEAEIAMMRTWLTRRNESTEMPGHGAHHMHADPTIPIMPGMLSPAQMTALAASDARQFDQLFLSGMIDHHQGAIDMVYSLLAEDGAGEDPEISEFLSAIIADQTTEIMRMRAMLAELG
jgi:uncharacterized protein (DUF305 family)